MNTVTDMKMRQRDDGSLEMDATVDGVETRYTSSDEGGNWSLEPPWYPLLCAVEPRWHDSDPEVGHAAALAFLTSVYDGDEPERWKVCIDDEAVLRVNWPDTLAEDALDPDGGTVGPVRDVAVVPLLSNIPEMTVWGDSADVPLYEWKPAPGPLEKR